MLVGPSCLRQAQGWGDPSPTHLLSESWIFKYNAPPFVLFLYKTKQYQERGIRELDLKIQQTPPLESAGMPRLLG